MRSVQNDTEIQFNIMLYYTNMDCCRVQWFDLLHCGNVILPKAKITPETLIIPFRPEGNISVEGVIFGQWQYDVTAVQ